MVLAIAAGTGIGLYLHFRQPPPKPTIEQAAVTRGEVSETVISTGTLQAFRTVAVGTQVSGTVQHLYADFNSIVKKGQVLATLDPSLMEQALDSAQAAVDTAKITQQHDETVLDQDRRDADRAQQLFEDDQVTEQERDQAHLTVSMDEAKVEQDEDAVTVAEAKLKQAQTNVDYCTIHSPVDGVVIARNVDQGQTVASSFTTPTLFTLATDPTKLQLIASVDEADVARIRPKQNVIFSVDAYKNEQFRGTVSEVRLNATTTNNVVTYQVVSNVPNPKLRLMPGMTTNLTIEISHADDVVRVPVEAVRFRPAKEVFEALGQTAPPPARVTPASRSTTFVQKSPASVADRTSAQAPTEIDAMFAPIAPTVTSGQVWVYRDGQLTPIDVKVGMGDATWVQLISGDLQPGDQVVTAATMPVVARPGFSPLVPANRSRSTLRRMR